MTEGIPTGRKAESKESKEVFKASLGFDFVFTEGIDGTKEPVCIEFNGEESGIGGIQDIPRADGNQQSRQLAAIRGQEDQKHAKRRAMLSELADKKKIAKSKDLNENPYFKHAFRNPAEIQSIALNKKLQQEFIPEQYQPRRYDPLSAYPPFSLTGKWIVKPNVGRGGKRIEIMTDKELDTWLQKGRLEHPLLNVSSIFTIEELAQSIGADLAPEDKKNNPASLRLLVDFSYRADGTIRTGYETAYQRVSQYSRNDQLAETDPGEVFVVNRLRGASSVPASEEEIRKARKVAYEIISNLGRAYQDGTITKDREGRV